MPFTNYLPAVSLFFLAALAASPCQADELPPKVVEFFRARDTWLLARIRAEVPPFQPTKSQTRVRDALRDEEARLADNKAKLDPTQRRIEKNRHNPSLASVVQKDEVRAKELQDAIQASEERIAKLRDELPAEEELAKAAKEEWQRRLSEVTAAKLIAQRADLALMPPGKGKLSPGHLKVGDVGLLPQWPVVIVDGVPAAQGWPVSVEDLPLTWRTRFFQTIDMALSRRTGQKQHDVLERHGGPAIAKKRDNLHVIRVIDEHRLLVSFIQGNHFDWPEFIWDTGDTGNYGDDSTLRVDSLVMVAGTMRYTSDGVGRTAFVLKPFDSQLPTYSDEPAPVPRAKLTDKPSPGAKEASTRPLDLDVLEVGAIGLLPQWPVRDRLRHHRRRAEDLRECAEMLSVCDVEDEESKQTTFGTRWKDYKAYIDRYGGVGVARDQCNVRVVQVLDEGEFLSLSPETKCRRHGRYLSSMSVIPVTLQMAPRCACPAP